MTKTEQPSQVTHPEHPRGGRTYLPNVDIIENADEVLVLADVPGAGADSIDITYEQGVLEIRAQVEPRQREADTNYLLREYATGDYYRSFRLGRNVDPANINAEFKNGVLTLHLPKAEQARKRQIEVKAS